MSRADIVAKDSSLQCRSYVCFCDTLGLAVDARINRQVLVHAARKAFSGWIAEVGHETVVRTLNEEIANEEDGTTNFDIALELADPGLLAVMLDTGCAISKRLAYSAVTKAGVSREQRDDTWALPILLSHGMSPDYVVATPLQFGFTKGARQSQRLPTPLLWFAVSSLNAEASEILLNAGARSDFLCSGEPLFAPLARIVIGVSTSRVAEAIFDLLAKRGMDIGARSSSGTDLLSGGAKMCPMLAPWMALKHRAAGSMRNVYVILDKLLSTFRHQDDVDKMFVRAFDEDWPHVRHAVQFGHDFVAKRNLLHAAIDGRKLLSLSLMVAQGGLNPGAAVHDGESPIAYAKRKRFTEAIGILLAAQADRAVSAATRKTRMGP